MAAKSYKALKAEYEGLPEDVQDYFWRLSDLLSDGSHYDLAVAYIFMMLEAGHHRALKCGLVRIHKCKSSKVDEALDVEHFTRSHFQDLFEQVFNKKIPDSSLAMLKEAEEVRDRLIHGKSVSDPDFRTAIQSSIGYIKKMGALVEKKTGKNPFGNLKGLVGRSELLGAQTSYFVMKGLGFSLKGVSPVDV